MSETVPSITSHIGGIMLGVSHPVRIQSMTNTVTTDIQATVEQCMRAFDSGAALMRISIPDSPSVEAFRKIKQKLHQSGFRQPLIADIHFQPKLAVEAARYADKVRINPGNLFDFPKEKTDSERFVTFLIPQLKNLTDVCRDCGTAIRIGTNAASLPQHITNNMGVSAEAMVAATIQYLQAFEALDFQNIVLSLKSSSPLMTIEAYDKMHKQMQKDRMMYPLHLGVTESGEGLNGRMKSAMGIIPLLQKGIGNTIRVSLTEPPEREIAFAQKLLNLMNPSETSDPCSGHPDHHKSKTKKSYNDKDPDLLVIKLVRDFGESLLKGNHDLPELEMPGSADPEIKQHLINQLLQASGKVQTDTDFVSCPGCARTSFDMRPLLKILKDEFSGMPGLKIALMGCTVNGPGEMQGADYGLLCSSGEKVHLYKGQNVLHRNLDPTQAINILKDIIKKQIKPT